MRTIVCAALALVLFAGIGVAADKGKKKGGKTVTGEIVSVDPEKGTLKIQLKGKKGKPGKEVEFSGITDTTPVVSYSGEEKQTLTGKDVLKKEQFKKGTRVTVVTDAEGKVTEVRFGNPPRKKKNK